MEEIAANPSDFWLSLGALLLAAELLGTGGYLLWSGIAALLIGIAVAIFPINWPLQGGFFSVLTLITAVIWHRCLRKRFRSQPDLLNQRNQKMIGLRSTLTKPTLNGYGRIQIADGSWRIYSETQLSEGTEVEVILVKGNTLYVKKVAKSS